MARAIPSTSDAAPVPAPNEGVAPYAVQAAASYLSLRDPRKNTVYVIFDSDARLLDTVYSTSPRALYYPLERLNWIGHHEASRRDVLNAILQGRTTYEVRFFEWIQEKIRQMDRLSSAVAGHKRGKTHDGQPQGTTMGSTQGQHDPSAGDRIEQEQESDYRSRA